MKNSSIHFTRSFETRMKRQIHRPENPKCDFHSLTVQLLKIINIGHSMFMSGLTLFANLLLCVILLRKSRAHAILTDSKRSKQERGVHYNLTRFFLYFEPIMRIQERCGP